MSSTTDRHEFASDNTAAICPEAFAALQEANAGNAASYGEDKWTKRVCDQVREIFETDCDVFFVFNGTAANSLALSQLCQSFHSIICHEFAHIETDECGGPEFFTKGSKLLPVAGANGKLDLVQVEAVVAKQRDFHSHKPRAISVTQATEFGTVYTVEELGTIADIARRYSLRLHMDGARFANAVAALDCAPKTISWQAGVDVLCFGGTKNGTAAGWLVSTNAIRSFACAAVRVIAAVRRRRIRWAGIFVSGLSVSQSRCRANLRKPEMTPRRLL